MQTVLTQIIKKFNNEFDKQKFLDWFNNSKESWLVEEKEQIKKAFNQGYRDGEIDSQSMANDEDISSFVNAENYYNNTFKND